MKRADKYPLIDPRLPRLYSRILEAANKMRAGQQAGVAILEAQRRAARIASLSKIIARELDSPLEKSNEPTATA